MTYYSKIPHCLLVFTIVFSLPILVQMECCDRRRKYGQNCGSGHLSLCADCSWPTPCCGYGPCNIFCCNCDYGCRRPSRSLNATKAVAGPQDFTETKKKVDRIMKDLDTNKDGAIDIHEFRVLRRTDPIDVLYEFNSLDEDGDGFIVPQELDNDYQ